MVKFTKMFMTLLLLLVAGVASAQDWVELPTQGWVHEWRTMDTQTDGAALTDGDGAYKVYVRSAAQAGEAGNATTTGGALADDYNNFAGWDSQFFITFAEENALKAGDKFRVSFSVKADANATIATQSHAAPGAYIHWYCIGDVSVTTDWAPYTSSEIEVQARKSDGNFDYGKAGEGMYTIAFNLSDAKIENTFYFKDIKVEILKEKTVDTWTNIVFNSDMEGNDDRCFWSKNAGETQKQGVIEDGIGYNGTRAIRIQSADRENTGEKDTNGNDIWTGTDWDAQFFVRLAQPVKPGTKYKVSFNYKANKAGRADSQSHGEPGGYIHWACIGSPNFTTEWQTYTAEGTISAEMSKDDNLMKTIAFNLSCNHEATEFVFDNFVFEIPADDVTLSDLDYYLVGNMNEWTPAADYKLVANEAAVGEYMITLDLEAGAEFKIKKGETWYPGEGTGNYIVSDAGNYTIYFRPNYDGGDDWYNKCIYAVRNADLNTYTATFTTNAFWWDEVYAYAWSEGENVTEYLGAWPGTKLKVDATGAYIVNVEGEVAPEKIIFNNGNSGEGNQTEDLAFEEGKAYEYVFTPTFDFENNNGNWANDATTFTMDDITLTGTKNAKYKDGKFMVGSRAVGSFALTAPKGKSIAKIELKVLKANEFNLTPSTGEVARTKVVKQGEDESADVLYSIWTWTGNGTEVSFDLSDAAQRNLGFINVTLEDAVPYYLVGNMTNWVDEGVKDEFNFVKNTEAAEGVEEYVIKNVALTTESQLKVVKVNEDGGFTWYPSGDNYGANGEITVKGNYNIYFRPNGDGAADWFYGVLYVVDTVTDGINAVSTPVVQNAVIFNMAGQRVMNAKKGLYIVNGKKMVIR